jgi:hypothetical protein
LEVDEGNILLITETDSEVVLLPPIAAAINGGSGGDQEAQIIDNNEGNAGEPVKNGILQILVGG